MERLFKVLYLLCLLFEEFHFLGFLFRLESFFDV